MRQAVLLAGLFQWGGYAAAAPTLDCAVTSFGGYPNYVDGPSGTFNAPKSLAIDPLTGAMYVADEGNLRIRLLWPNGTVSTVAGNGVASSLDGVGTLATFRNPTGVALDPLTPGTLYVVDYGANLVRTIDLPSALVSRLAGTGAVGAADGAALGVATFSAPYSVAAYGGIVYVTDANAGRVRRISGGIVDSIGSGISGNVDGPCDRARFQVRGIALSPLDSSKLYVVGGTRMCVISFSPVCMVSTIAGNADAAWVDGTGTAASFSFPQGLGFDAYGNAYVADTNNMRLRRVSPDGTTVTLAGSGRTTFAGAVLKGYTADGVGLGASFNLPRHAAVAPSGVVYVSDGGSNYVRVVTCPVAPPSATPTSFASTTSTPSPTYSFSAVSTPSVSRSPSPTPSLSSTPSVTGTPRGCLVSTLVGAPQKTGYVNGVGTAARLANVTALATNASFAVFFAEKVAHTVRVWIPATNAVTNFSGAPYSFGFVDGVASAARFNTPVGMAAFTNSSNVTLLYVADLNNHAIRLVYPDGSVATVIGTGAAAATFVPTFRLTPTAQLSSPWGVALDKTGRRLYVTEVGFHVVRVIENGIVTTLWGVGAVGTGIPRDGVGAGGTAAMGGLYYPRGIFVTPTDTVILTESWQRIRALQERTGLVTTLAGNNLLTSFPANNLTDGPASESTWALAYAMTPHLAIDPATGGILIATAYSLRSISPDSLVTTLAGAIYSGADHLSTDGFGANARFDFAGGLVVDASGAFIVGEILGCVLRRVVCPAAPASSVTLSVTPTPAAAPALPPNTCTVTTVSGTGRTPAADGTIATAAYSAPCSVTLGPPGSNTLYVSGNYAGSDHAVRVLDLVTGSVATFAGDIATFGFVNGVGTNARFYNLGQVVTAGDGTLFLADRSNYAIRSVSPSATVNSVCGSGAGSTVGAFAVTKFNTPTGIALSPDENLIYVADTYNNRLVVLNRLTSTSSVLAAPASFNFPRFLLLNASLGAIFVGDVAALWKIDYASGNSSIFAGSNATGYVDGSKVVARFDTPLGLVQHPIFGLLLGELNNRALRAINLDTGETSTVAGSFATTAVRDGPAHVARLGSLTGLAFDPVTGNTYFADKTANLIRVLKCDAPTTMSATRSRTPSSTISPSPTPTAGGAPSMSATATLTPTPSVRPTPTTTPGLRSCTISTVAGVGSAGAVDGIGTASTFWSPADMVRSTVAQTLFYVADARNNMLRTLNTSSYAVSTIAGGLSGGYADGPALGGALFRGPSALAINGSEVVFIADTLNHAVRYLSGGAVYTLAGTGVAGNTTGSPTLLRSPAGVAVDATTCYVADSGNNVIKAVTLGTGVSRVLAGSGGFGWNDAIGTAAVFAAPRSIRFRVGTGTLFVSDNSTRVRAVTVSSGATLTVAGGVPGFGDGSTATASFAELGGLDLSNDGTLLFVVDTGNQMLRQIDLVSLSVSRLGGTGATGMTTGFATTASLGTPRGVALETSGTLLVTSADANSIVRVACPAPPPQPACNVTLYAGSTSLNGYQDATTPLSARFKTITKALAFNSSGFIFVGDEFNHRIRLISPLGQVSTFVGNGSGVSGDGVGTSSSLFSPVGVTVDASSGVVFVVEYWSCSVRRVWPDATSEKLIGGACTGFVEGPFASATINYAWGVAARSNYVYVGDTGFNRIRQLDLASRTTSTIAGNGGAYGHADGVGTAASLAGPRAVVLDSATGILYFSEVWPYLRAISLSTRVVTTVAGTGLSGWLDAVGERAWMFQVDAFSLDYLGGLIFAEAASGRVRRLDISTGAIVTLAGRTPRVNAFAADGAGTNAAFSMPRGVAVDEASGNIYVADGPAIRLVKCAAPTSQPTPTASALPLATSSPTPSATPAVGNTCSIKTAAGQGAACAWMDGLGSNAFLNAPRGVAVSADNQRVYVSDTGANVIRIATPFAGAQVFMNVSTIAGTGAQDYVDSTRGDWAAFFAPEGLALSRNEAVLLVADTGSHVIRAVDVNPLGSFGVSTLGGVRGRPGDLDGPSASALLNFPVSLSLGAIGVAYGAFSAGDDVVVIVERGNSVVRVLSLTAGAVGTLAGNAGAPSFSDGAGTFAAFLQPSGVAVGFDGTVYVSDTQNYAIRVVTPSGFVSTLVGAPPGPFAFAFADSTDGPSSVARFTQPRGLAFAANASWIGANSSLLVVDSNRVRVITLEFNTTRRSTWSATSVSTLGGLSNFGASWTDGLTTSTNAGFYGAWAVAVADAASVWLVETQSCLLRRILCPDRVWRRSSSESSAPAAATATAALSTLASASPSSAPSACTVRTLAGTATTTYCCSSPVAMSRYDGVGGGAYFNSPRGVAIIDNATILVADFGLHALRTVSVPAGSVRTIAGALAQQGYADGPALDSRLNGPMGLQIDAAAGAAYFTEYNAHRIRAYYFATKICSTVAGTGVSGYFDDTTWATSLFASPSDVAPAGGSLGVSLFVWDLSARIRVLWVNGTVSSIGTGAALSLDGPANLASFGGTNTNSYYGLAWSAPRAQLFVTQGTGVRVVSWTAAGFFVTTLAGVRLNAAALNFLPGFYDGVGTNAAFMSVAKVSIAGNSSTLFVADFVAQRIRSVALDGTVTSIAGSGVSSYFNGDAQSAAFRSPFGIAVDATASNIFVTESNHGLVRWISCPPSLPSATLSPSLSPQQNSTATCELAPVAGRYGFAANSDGDAAARFNSPLSLAFDPISNSTIVGDRGNNRLRRVDAAARTTTILGNFPSVVSGNTGGTSLSGATVTIQNIGGVAVGPDGSVIFTDVNAGRIGILSAQNGAVTVLAGSSAGFSDGTGPAALFNSPQGVACCTPEGAIVVSDFNNRRVRVVTLQGVVTSLAGSGTLLANSPRTGIGTNAVFVTPRGVAVTKSGVIFVSDAGSTANPISSARILSISQDGTVRLLAGGGSASFGPVAWATGISYADGVGTNAVFTSGGTAAVFITLDPTDSFLVVPDNQAPPVLRLVTLATGAVTTLRVAGTASGPNLGFFSAVFAAKDLLVVDSNAHTLSRVVCAASVLAPSSVAVSRQSTTSPAAANTCVVSHVAGSLSFASGAADGSGTNVLFNKPNALDYDDYSLSLYVIDQSNCRVRSVSLSGDVRTVAGGGVCGFRDAVGTQALFNGPQGVCVGASVDGEVSPTAIFVADSANHRIRYINLDSYEVRTFSGGSAFGSTNGVGTNVRYNSPVSCAVTREGIVFVSDCNNG